MATEYGDGRWNGHHGGLHRDRDLFPFPSQKGISGEAWIVRIPNVSWRSASKEKHVSLSHGNDVRARSSQSTFPSTLNQSFRISGSS